MGDAAQKAMKVLLGIAEDENVDDETRIRAACAVLDRADKVGAEGAKVVA